MVGLLKKEGRVGFGFYKKVCHSLAGEGGIEAFKKLKTFLVFSPSPFSMDNLMVAVLLDPSLRSWIQ